MCLWFPRYHKRVVIIKKILKKNKNYQNLGILNISISNFKAEILCLETKKMIKVNRPYYFMNATELK